ncbi:thiamine biosynthesis protein ThiS [Fervidicella metallireducens AeB]|uniref:Thiamine biosynthesis protein ThiS n=1 Tax=Fervidicella metallireducens AeB TaxID=1403537 RepID=A0A017RW90_9CLOT|nr:sulfur carrier protein ThiS [Fervidicella metallireducens]EYE88659.1 thiamine biosynthesis protein ThiS [Fervidicella metallireducens AeB]
MIINGKNMEFDNGINIMELLKKFNLSEDKVVVELNYEIIPKEKFSQIVLNKEDKLEIVSFVGGG